MIRRTGRVARLAVLAASWVTLAGAAGCAAQGTGASGPGPGGHAARLYVASQEAMSVSVFDMASGSLVETVDLTALGFSATGKAHHVAVEPDGSFWYVSLIAEGVVLKFDRANALVGRAEFETPGMLALDPGSDLLYVGRSMAAVSPPQRIGMIRRSTMELEEVDVFFPRPHALTLDPVGDRVFTASLGESRLAYAPIGAEEVDLASFPGHHHMIVQFAVSPDGRWMVGGGQMSGELLVWDLSGGAPEVVRTVDVGGQPWHPSFTPDGTELWVPNQAANTVTVLRTADWSVVEVIAHPGLAEPHGSAVSHDGRTVFVSGRNTRGTWGQGNPGTVVVIDRATRTVREVVDVGAYAAGMAAPPILRP